ncbi:hypothetical protein JCM1841_006924 [Sporobolomyces salmonicolor]
MSPAAPVYHRKRLSILLLAFSIVVFHLWLAGKLAALQATLRAALGQGEDGDLEGGDWRRLEGIRALIGIGRAWSLCSALIAAAGLYAVFRDHLPLLRLFTLNSFLSLALDLLLLLLVLLLALSSASSGSSSRSLATTLCQTLSTSNSPSDDEFGWLPDYLGLSLEACEERFDGVLLSGLIALAAVEGLRGWAAVRVLEYYAACAKKRPGSGAARRRGLGSNGGARIDVDDQTGGRYYDSPVELEHPSSSSGGGGGGKGKHREREHSARSGGDRETRILLLPRSDERSQDVKERKGDAGPLISVTPSSPTRTSFPPTPSTSIAKGQGVGEEGGPKRVMVYTPIMMTAEEARLAGASELVLHTAPSTRRTRSYSSTSNHTHSSISHSGRRSRSSTINPASAAASSAAPVAPVAPAALSLDLPPSKIGRQDSDDLPTPLADGASHGVLRGDLEDDWEHGKQA